MKEESVIKMSCLLVIVLLINSACKKNTAFSDVKIQDSTTRIDPQLTAVMRETADAMEKVYLDQKALVEVDAAIRSGFYEDERVLLRDLILPQPNGLYSSAVFKTDQVDTGYFRKAFCNIIFKGNYPMLQAELKTVLFPATKKSTRITRDNSLLSFNAGIFSSIAPLAIYFPYSENFPAVTLKDTLPADNKLAIIRKPTLVYSDREADSAPGRDPHYCPGLPGNICYKEVFVDDNYAYSKATHIVTIGAVPKVASNITVPKTELVHRVYHGSSRLTRQMDKLISFTGNGGGSEIKVCRINGFLRRTGDHIDDFSGDIITLYYTRGEIRNKEWKRVFSIWDPNWNYQDIEQIYAVYEDDTKGTRTIDGSLKTTLNLPGKIGKVEGDIGFKILASTQDEIITQRKLDRKSFLRDGLNNQGWGYLPDPADFLSTSQDWPVYDGGSIWQYTLPYRIY